MSSKTFLIAVITLCSAVSSFAWLRSRISDAELVSRAELIVVGHIRDGSIVHVEHTNSVIYRYGRSWEHHVDLVISEVLKGQETSNSLVVSIHYGLDPVSGSHFGTNYAKDSIVIEDTGNSISGLPPVSGDIRTNQIWLLHRVEGLDFDSDWIGIYDPQDIQPVSKKTELLRYLK